MKKKNAINLLYRRILFKEKILAPFMFNCIWYVNIRAKIVQCELGIRLDSESWNGTCFFSGSANPMSMSLSDGRTFV